MAKQGKKVRNKSSKAITGSLKDLDQKRKQVFKPVLDNPFTQSNLWPFIKPELAEQIIQLLELILAPIGNYYKLSREIKQSGREIAVKPPVPHNYHDILVGFNSTVSSLERQARRRIISFNDKNAATTAENTTQKYFKYVFVTKYDITPTVITSMFPMLTYTSSRSSSDRVKLVQLPRGASTRISEVLGIENSGIVALTADIVEATGLYQLIDSEVADVNIPWLQQLLDEDHLTDLESLASKFLATSAPVLPKKNDQKAKNREEKARKKETAKRDVGIIYEAS
ncbi:hypothetical protein G9P44_001312 [Scheffersomyces stipitis]|nr:hypothetical protein G9P44_001312 [Scheffersomyces stipitis]